MRLDDRRRSKRPELFALNTDSEGDIIAGERGSLDYRRLVQSRRTRTKVIVALSEAQPRQRTSRVLSNKSASRTSVSSSNNRFAPPRLVNFKAPGILDKVHGARDTAGVDEPRQAGREEAKDARAALSASVE